MDKHKRVAVTNARREFFRLSNKVGDKKESMIITRNGKDFIACIPIEEFEFLQECRKKQEDNRKKSMIYKESMEKATSKDFSDQSAAQRSVASN